MQSLSKKRQVRARHIAAAAVASLFSAACAHAGVLFDSLTPLDNGTPGADYIYFGATDSTGAAITYGEYVGGVYNLPSGTTDITGFDSLGANVTGNTYAGMKVTIYVWGAVNTPGSSGYNASTPAYSNLLGTYSFVDSTDTFSNNSFIDFENDGINPDLPITPLMLTPQSTPRQIGITINYQGTTDGTNFASAPGLSPVLANGAAPSAGYSPLNGENLSVNGETNGNFTSGPYNLATQNDPTPSYQTLVLRIFGDAPSATASGPVYWNLPFSGDWNTASNWNPSTVPVNGNDAVFNTAGGSNYIVTASQAQTVSDLYVQHDIVTIDLNSVTSSLTIAGTLSVGVPQTSGQSIAGALTFTNSFGLSAGNVSAATVVIGGNGGTGTLTIGSGATSTPVTLSVAGAVNVSAGSLLTIATGGKLTLSSLSIAGTTGAWTGLVDIGTGALDLPSPASLETVTNQVKQAYSNGNWNGTGGITSTAAAADFLHLTAVGVISNNVSGSALYGGTGVGLGTFNGQTPGVNDVLVKYTYYGDANLDGKVDGSDYARIDASFLSERTSGIFISGWINGDFNYDGIVNGSDYTLMDNAFNFQGFSDVNADSGIGHSASSGLLSSSPSSGYSVDGYTQIGSVDANPTTMVATSAVPEPASTGLIGVAAVRLLSRRNKRLTVKVD